MKNLNEINVNEIVNDKKYIIVHTLMERFVHEDNILRFGDSIETTKFLIDNLRDSVNEKYEDGKIDEKFELTENENINIFWNKHENLLAELEFSIEEHLMDEGIQVYEL